MAPARAYLVYLGDDPSSPHGYVWLTADKVKPGHTWKATAAGLARGIYLVPANTTVSVKEATRLCEAIRRRRHAAGSRESFADSHRAVLEGRTRDILKRAGLWHTRMSPGGVGLL